MATNPYRTQKTIEDQYAKQYGAYSNQLNKQAQDDIASANQQYDANQRSNYVNYMMGQRDLANQLGQMGIRGGGSETSMLRARTNYENNWNSTEGARNSAINDINKTMQNNLAAYKLQADQNMAAEIQAEKEKAAAWEEEQQQKAENRYASTISGWNSISAINKEIQRIKASGKGKWRIYYLRARRTELQNEAKDAASGGGGYGYGYSGYGGGGGNTETEETPEEKLGNKLSTFSTGWGKKRVTNTVKKPSVNGWYGVQTRNTRYGRR